MNNIATPPDSAIRLELSRQWVGDQQGFLAAEARLILRGKLRGTLTDQHREALVIANRQSIGHPVDLDTLPF